MVDKKRGRFLHRSSIDIIRDVLATARSGIRKTRLMTAVDISHQMMNRYLLSLKGKGLIREEVQTDGSKIFRTTDRGLTFIDIYQDACKIAGYNRAGSEPGNNAHLREREFHRVFDW